MSRPSVDTVFIVGAGFSYYAGLPLTTDFTKAILETRWLGTGTGPQALRGANQKIVAYLTEFIQKTFDLSSRAKAPKWPQLEDVFTCIDLAANAGHHLGSSYAPADLRTVRRALLSRIIRMLDEKYQSARRLKAPAWRQLDDFFLRLESKKVGFVSMNWDTVIERKLDATQQGDFLPDYGCDAMAATIPSPPDLVACRRVNVSKSICV